MSVEGASGLIIRLLGPLGIERDGQALKIPASRKARAILGYLILARRPVTRQRLCDLFFDVPDDPRASLRWTLTKLRQLVDEPGVQRIQAVNDTVSFSPAGASVDVLDVLRGGQALPALSGLFLEDAELPERQDFMLWLHGARDELRLAAAAHLKEALAAPGLAAERRLSVGRQLLALDPLDEKGCVAVIGALAELGRAEAAREALAEAERLFRRAGLAPPASLRAALAPGAASKRRTGERQIIDMLPCVALLPFQNYSPDTVSDDLMDGFLESVTHNFSRFHVFRIHDVGALKGQLQDPLELHARAGVDYVIGGSIIVRGAVPKIRYRIIDSRSGALLGSGELVGASVSPAAMIEDMPADLAPNLMFRCLHHASARAATVAPADRTPVDHQFIGMGLAYFSTAPDFFAALQCFEAALAARPDYAQAMAGAAHCKATLQLARHEPARSQTLEQAHAAIALAKDDAFSLALAAWSLVQIGREVEPAVRAADLAVRANPLARIGWTVSAWIRAMNGEYETPMAHWERAEKCNPLGTGIDLDHSGRALCCWMAGRYEDALAWAKRSLERVPSNPGALTAAVAAAAMLEDQAALRSMSKKLLQHYPDGADSAVLSNVPIVAAERREAILAAVRQGLAAAASA